MKTLVKTEKKFDIKVVRIYDHYGYIITRLRDGKVYTSEQTYPEKFQARSEAIEKANIL